MFFSLFWTIEISVNFAVPRHQPFLRSVTLDGIERLLIDEPDKAYLQIVFNWDFSKKSIFFNRRQYEKVPSPIFVTCEGMRMYSRDENINACLLIVANCESFVKLIELRFCELLNEFSVMVVIKYSLFEYLIDFGIWISPVAEILWNKVDLFS